MKNIKEIEVAFNEKFLQKDHGTCYWDWWEKQVKPSDIKSFYRTALSTLLQQVGEETIERMENALYEKLDKSKDWGLEYGDITNVANDVRSKLDSVINPLPSEV